MTIIWPPSATDSVSGLPLMTNIFVGHRSLILDVASHASGQIPMAALILATIENP